MNSETQYEKHQPQSEELDQNGDLKDKVQDHYTVTLPIVDPLLIEKSIPDEVVLEIGERLLPGESVFVLFRLNSNHSFHTETGKVEKAPFWTVITGNRLLLIAVSSEGQAYCDVFEQSTFVQYQDGIAWDEIKIANKTISAAIWEGHRKLFKEAANLFPLPEYEKYLYIANIYLNKGQYAEAIPFLRKSIESIPTIKVYLLLVQSLSRHQKPDEAIAALHEALQLTEPTSLLEEIQLLFPQNIEMLLYLAVVCEEDGRWDDCIHIYQNLLQKTPDFDLYFIKLGEMYNAKQEYATAIEYYQKFIKLRTESAKFAKGELIHWDMSNFIYFSADSDLIKAYMDLGIIYEREHQDLEKAASFYLAVVKHAPFYPDAYKRFWTVCQQFNADPFHHFQDYGLHAKAFLQTYKLLDPKGYASTVHPDKVAHIPGTFPGPDILIEPPDLPIAYYPIAEAEREILIHPGEREYFRRVQNWLTSLVIPEEDSQGIEQYCEQVNESNFPELSQTIKRIAGFLDIKPPGCFISRGKIGISVQNKEKPFIFIGSEHLDEENERYLLEGELLFLIAAQMEHIKAGHILITGTELWKSLGTASFDGFLVALQCLPAGGFLGRLTHRFATVGLKKMYQMTGYSGMQKILKFLEKTVTVRNAEDESEHYEEQETGQKADSAKAKKQTAPESPLKEQLVDFARHAVYTADRVGLLACNSIEFACSAIFKLAGDAYNELGNIHHDGLIQVLKKKDKRGNFLYCEYARRFSELIKFALSEEYYHLHSKFVVLPEEPQKPRISPKYRTEYQELVNKLNILEQSRKKELLSSDEFFAKQRTLLCNSEILLPDDHPMIDKLQQACREGVLIYNELQQKILEILEKRLTGKEENGTLNS